MELQPYVENIQRQVIVGAEAGGDDARALADRLLSSLDAAIRLTLQDALVAAAEEITCELAPGSVELRLRGRDPEFVVTAAAAETSADDLSESDDVTVPVIAGAAEADDGAMSRINLRMPDQLKGRVERAAAGGGVSVNSWLVRAATAALERPEPGPRRESRAPRSGQRYTGWAR
ncbi:MAG: hypothetical protein ACLPVY_08690 [Acidimicrobiia bacterium]